MGVDPGKSGAWALIDETGAILKVGMHTDLSEMISTLKWAAAEQYMVIACLERAQAMPSQGVVSMFTYGQSFGEIIGILKSLGVPYELVSSNYWQKRVLDIMPAKEIKHNAETKQENAGRRTKNRNALKAATTAFVLRRFPKAIELLRLKKNQGVADAICIALYSKARNERHGG